MLFQAATALKRWAVEGGPGPQSPRAAPGLPLLPHPTSLHRSPGLGASRGSSIPGALSRSCSGATGLGLPG